MALNPDQVPQTGIPVVDGVRMFLRAVDLLDGLPFGDSSIQQANRRAARAAGYTGTRAQLNAIGEGLRNADEFAAQTANRDRAGFVPPPPPPPPRPPAGGPSIPDQAGLPSIPGLPTSIPLPSIPGLPTSIPIPAIPPAALPVILGPIITAGLFWPTAAGRGSDLRDLYGMPAPGKGKKRIPGRRARGRRRTKIPNPWGPPRTRTGVKVPPAGRGGPVTISRPNARALPPPVVIPAQMPRPGVLGPPGAGVKINTGPIKAAPPAKVPQTRAQQTAAAARAVLGLPIIGDLIKSALGGALTSLFVKSPGAQLGRVTLPNTGPLPLPALNPLTALNPAALSFARPLALTNAATQEQDCSCRPARKKRTKKPCKNPVTSSRSFKRDGKRFRTTTKEIKCQASSKKKRALQLVR